MSYTTGPWLISKLASPDYAPEFGIYAEGEQQDLARVVGWNSAANAALIAAAPDMLEALQLIATIGEGSTTPNSLQHIAKLARAAIQKATDPT